MASDRDRGLVPRVNFFDGQKVTESDMDSEQIYNRSMISNVILDFHSSGVVNQDPFGTRILLDTRTPGYYAAEGTENRSKTSYESGSYDGMFLDVDIQPTDYDMGCRLEVELIDSDAYGRRETRVFIIGKIFNGIGSSGDIFGEVIKFNQNGRALTKKYYKEIIGVAFNNFSGGAGKTYFESKKNSLDLISETGGGVVIREASAMSVFPKTEVVSQVESPNIDFANFITSSTSLSLEEEIKKLFGFSVSFNDLYFELNSESSLRFESNSDTSLMYGQKFLYKSNNLQKVDVLFSVERDSSRPAGAEYDFSGDIVLSIHELSTETACPTDPTPDNLIDFDPEPSPLIEMSLSQDDLFDLGYVLGDVPQRVSFNFSGTLIADPSIEPNMSIDKYYAVLISRRGDNRVGTLILERGYDKPTRKSDNGQSLTSKEMFAKQSQRFVEYDPDTKRFIDNQDASLWISIHSDTIEILNGTAYGDSGFPIAIPKTEEFVGSTKISNFEENIPLSSVAEGDSNYVVLDSVDKFASPSVHPRTGNFVFTRILDAPSGYSADEDGLVKITNEDLGEYPLILARVTDNNVRDAEDIDGQFDKPGCVLRDKIYILNPSSDILNSNLINRVITPDIDCQCASRYRIARARCMMINAGDFDDDGSLTDNDILELLKIVGNTINSSVTEKRLLGEDLSILDFLRADLNNDDTIDGLDIELLEDAVDGYVNFDIDESFGVLELTVENITESSDYPIIFSDEDGTGYTRAGTSNLLFEATSSELALVPRKNDVVTIPGESADGGVYYIENRASDGTTVSVTLVDSDGNEPSFVGSTGLNISISSHTAVNILADNNSLMSVPYKPTSYSISFVDAPFESRFIDVCDLRRFVEGTIIEEASNSCLCVTEECVTPDVCSPSYKNQHILPNDLYIPSGEIYSSPGVPYHGDFEYTNVRIPLPPGTIDDCQVNLYDTFIKSEEGSCKTAAGYPAMLYSDGTYVGCEDDGEDTDLTKNRIKISNSIASLYVDGLVDGYATDGGKDRAEETESTGHSESIFESFSGYTYRGFSSFGVLPTSSTSLFTIKRRPGPNQPLKIELSSSSDATKRYAKLTPPTEARMLKGDFVIDITARRSMWPRLLTSGTVSATTYVTIRNDDGSSAVIELGWEQGEPRKLEYVYRGVIRDSTGAIDSTFDYKATADDQTGDDVMFRIRRINDVCTASYINSQKMDLTENPDQQYIRIGRNPIKHPGDGDFTVGINMDQEFSPPAGLDFHVVWSMMSVKSNFTPDDSDYEETNISRAKLSKTGGEVQRATMVFPLLISSRTSIVSASMTFVSAETQTCSDKINIIPFNVINADNLSRYNEYPLTTDTSVKSTFIPGSVSEGEEVEVDITGAILSMLATSGHLIGYSKAFLIEPDDTSISSFKFLTESTKLSVIYLDTTTGVIFKVGVSVDPATGIATFNTRNILYDALVKENRTVIEFGVFLKKSGFINSDVSLSIREISNVGIGSCSDPTILGLDDECYFIAGSSGTGTFVEGPFPCRFHLP